MVAFIAAVVGLQREAALLAGPGVITVVGGGDRSALRRRLETLVAARSLRAVVSVGLGGALSPQLAVGDWVVGERIVGADKAWTSDPNMVAKLCAGLANVFTGAIAASDVMVVDARAKSALHARTGALAVDMESDVAAVFACTHGLAFAALRVISDGADRALPKAAQAGMKKDGGMDILAVLRELTKDPGQLPSLMRTAREAEIAFKQLRLLGRHNLLGSLGVGDLDLGQLPLDVI